MENRHGDGIIPNEVSDLISKIFRKLRPSRIQFAWNFRQLVRPVKTFSFEITQDAAGQLPRYGCDDKFASYTCEHTSMGLRCFNAG
eukprot:2865040-Pyramimonas_sp.AAC.1